MKEQIMIIRRSVALIGALSLASGALAACGSNPSTGGDAASGKAGGSGGASAQASASAALAALKEDSALHTQLPASIRSSGRIISVDSGSFPPYTIVGSNGKSESGAATDMGNAMGKVLGVKVQSATVDSLASELAGIDSGRYNLALGPVGDFKARETSADFVDWVREFVVFAVEKGNPNHITSLASTCGLKISVESGGSAEQVIKTQSKTCVKDGKPAVQVQSYKDQPTALLAVSSKRADGFFSSRAPLTYFVQHSNGDLQLAGLNSANGFSDLYQGALVAKGSPLGNILLKAFQELTSDGVYASVMQKWGLQANEIPHLGLNQATS
jgi:polar amino acid transport system substrate-binding protein